ELDLAAIHAARRIDGVGRGLRAVLELIANIGELPRHRACYREGDIVRLRGGDACGKAEQDSGKQSGFLHSKPPLCGAAETLRSLRRQVTKAARALFMAAPGFCGRDFPNRPRATDPRTSSLSSARPGRPSLPWDRPSARAYPVRFLSLSASSSIRALRAAPWRS